MTELETLQRLMSEVSVLLKANTEGDYKFQFWKDTLIFKILSSSYKTVQLFHVPEIEDTACWIVLYGHKTKKVFPPVAFVFCYSD